MSEELELAQRENKLSGPSKVVVAIDTQDLEDVVIVGINAVDRPGLLLDISRGLHSLGLQLHHTEASVILGRSISIWRCALIDEDGNANAAEMQTVLSRTIENEGGDGAVKQGGLSVIRAVVTDKSRLVGKTLEDIDFRQTYKAAIIGVQKKDKSEVQMLSDICFAPGDVLVLQSDEDSPLLARPPPNFYDAKSDSNNSGYNPKTIFNKAIYVGGLKLTSSSNDLKGKASETTVGGDDDDDVSASEHLQRIVWGDLHVIFSQEKSQNDTPGNSAREFLAAVKVSKKSEHIGKTVGEAGLNRQEGLFLVQVERPVTGRKTMRVSFARPSVMGNPFGVSRTDSVNDGSVMGSLTKGDMPKAAIPVPPEGHLQENDVLWFAGEAMAIADLRKIPGLVSVEDDEVQQIDEKLHDRRLVQAVVSKKGPLAGKTAGEVGFRTKYGAAVIAVHRDGTRVQDHPGNIRLRGGDVLLLEAGPTFIARNSDNQHSFALISEVKDSKPPRLNKLWPALALTLAMLIIVAIGPALFPDQNMQSLLVCSLVVSFIFVCFGVMSQQECRDAVDWTVYVTIASAFGIGIAMTKSVSNFNNIPLFLFLVAKLTCFLPFSPQGLANIIANGLVALGESLGIGYYGIYGSIYLATFLISNIVTNNAAAALMFPIGMILFFGHSLLSSS